ncbi:DUF3048 domain-containing protein [Kroppenstedtia pulmonis]|uniref:DUF3048 domain-containing protein n=1 Tax=Kroppenstedtia pulmonis TaxID=1380685 RepID=A0A7D3XL63_9BACL|nr:DUF3048 domain-containing protein [Kroppenstedtia pulmonis]QKG83489.1 DUF3048 domain-containing protein [Kroppenstedtia pulmonis]
MRFVLFHLFMLAILIISGCSSNPVEHVWKEKGKEQSQLREPFTGEPNEGEEEPAIMVMVNNQRQARPQTGLGQADLVVEMLAEGEITRFAAFYHSEKEGVVGPVRSLRPYYLDLAKGVGAVVAHAGGSPEAIRRVEKDEIANLDGIKDASRLFWREDFSPSPHNLYTDLAKLRQGAKQVGAEPDASVEGPWQFDPRGAASKGKTAIKVNVRYNFLYDAGYRYDADSGKYIRYTQGEKQQDRKSKQPLAMDNVLVLYAKHQTIDKAGRRDIDLKGKGTGYLFQKGKGIAVQWENRNGWIVPLAEGKVASLLPGKTWINIMPEDGGLSFSE